METSSPPQKAALVITWVCFCLMLLALPLQAQTDTTAARIPFAQKATQPNTARIIGVTGAALTAYAASMLWLNHEWYSQYDRGRFRFFNDNAEWNQIDKAGHIWTAYSQSLTTMRIYRWAGVKQRPSSYIGGSAGFTFQLGIEILDGFSQKWGASAGDILANTAGAAWAVGQELLWQEQRIRIKYSAHIANYSKYPDVVQQRAKDLYGTALPQKLLKDYNAQSYWLSVNPSAFMQTKPAWFPRWFNIAVGYKAAGLFGGFENVWTDEAGVTHNYTHINRERIFFISPDIDLSRINTRSKALKFVLNSVNIIKIPAPAISLSNSGKWQGYWLYW